MNRIIYGKWMWVDDRQVFRVIYITPQGKSAKADCRSSFSYDIAEAMARNV